MKSNKLSFEESLKRLEDIVEKMEKGALDLSEMIDLFEEGTKLSKACEDMLNKAQAKIEVLTVFENKPKEMLSFHLEEDV